MAERSALPLYPDVPQREDTPVIARLRHEQKLVLLDRPQLYVYVYHGNNTWDRSHWETNLLRFAHALKTKHSQRVAAMLINNSAQTVTSTCNR